MRGVEGGQNEAAGSPDGVGVELAMRQHCGAPVRKLSSLAASQVGEKRGEGRGSSGLYRGELRAAVAARSGGKWGRSCREGAGSSSWRFEKALTGGAHLSVREKRKSKGYRFSKVDGPWASSAAGPEGSPGPFAIFILFSPFLFQFSFLEIFSNPILIQNDSNLSRIISIKFRCKAYNTLALFCFKAKFENLK
jgi:hypothetical protein